MDIRGILKTAVVSAVAIAGVTNESAAHDKAPGIVEKFMQKIKDPNVKKHGNSNLLYDGNKLVVTGGECDLSAVRVVVNKKGNDLVTVFAEYNIQGGVTRNMKHVTPRGMTGHALVDDKTQKFVSSGHAIGAKWYDANGPLVKATDEVQLSFSYPQGCHEGSGRDAKSSNTPSGGRSTPSGSSGGCSCNGNNTGGGNSNNNSNSNGNNNSNNSGGGKGTGPGGGNSPPGSGDASFSDASRFLKPFIGPTPSMA